LNILFTAMMPAAPVNAARSAPTYPGVAFAKKVKLKSPSRRSFAHKTCRILYINEHLIQESVAICTWLAPRHRAHPC
jgi:hypothetical protein